MQAFAAIKTSTYVNFVPKNRDHKDYVTIKMGVPSSRIGKRGGEQFIYYGELLIQRLNILFFSEVIMKTPEKDEFNLKNAFEIF